MEDPVSILATCFQGTMNMLELAKKCQARFLLASSCGTYPLLVTITTFKADIAVLI
jgi:nucleoside-diphosphate-sugar epimerase